MFQSPGSGGGSNKPLRGGQGDLLEGGTRIPAFVSNLDKVFQKMTKMSVFCLFKKIPEQESRWKSSLKKCSCALVQVSLNLCAGVWHDEKSFPHRRLASHDCPRSSGGSGEFPQTQNCHFLKTPLCNAFPSK